MSLRRLWCWWLALMADAPSMLRRNGVGWIFRLILYHLFVSILFSEVLCSKYRNPSKNQLVYWKALSEVGFWHSSNWIFIFTVPFGILKVTRYSCKKFLCWWFFPQKKTAAWKNWSRNHSKTERASMIFWIFVDFYLAWGIRLVWLSSKSRLFGWWISLFWFTYLSILTIKTYQNCLEPLRSCPRKSTKNPTRCWTPLRGWSCFMWIMERKRCSDKNGEFFLELLDICGEACNLKVLDSWSLQHWYVKCDMSQVPNDEKKTWQKRATCDVSKG